MPARYISAGIERIYMKIELVHYTPTKSIRLIFDTENKVYWYPNELFSYDEADTCIRVYNKLELELFLQDLRNNGFRETTV